MKLSDSTYNILAWIGRYCLPALSVFVTSIGQIWGLPYTEKIALTICAIDVLLNTMLGISSSKYFEDKEIVSTVVDNNVSNLS